MFSRIFKIFIISSLFLVSLNVVFGEVSCNGNNERVVIDQETGNSFSCDQGVVAINDLTVLESNDIRYQNVFGSQENIDFSDTNSVLDTILEQEREVELYRRGSSNSLNLIGNIEDNENHIRINYDPENRNYFKVFENGLTERSTYTDTETGNTVINFLNPLPNLVRHQVEHVHETGSRSVVTKFYAEPSFPSSLFFESPEFIIEEEYDPNNQIVTRQELNSVNQEYSQKSYDNGVLREYSYGTLDNENNINTEISRVEFIREDYARVVHEGQLYIYEDGEYYTATVSRGGQDFWIKGSRVAPSRVNELFISEDGEDLITRALGDDIITPQEVLIEVEAEQRLDLNEVDETGGSNGGGTQTEVDEEGGADSEEPENPIVSTEREVTYNGDTYTLSETVTRQNGDTEIRPPRDFDSSQELVGFYISKNYDMTELDDMSEELSSQDNGALEQSFQNIRSDDINTRTEELARIVNTASVSLSGLDIYEDFTLSELERAISENENLQNSYNLYQNFRSGNWNEIEQLNTGTISQMSVIIDTSVNYDSAERNLRTLQNEIENLQEQITNAQGEDLERLQEELELKQDELNRYSEIIRTIGEDNPTFLSRMVGQMSLESVEAALQEGDSCQGSWTNAWCLFSESASVEKELLEGLNSRIDQAYSSCQGSADVSACINERSQQAFDSWGEELGIESCDANEGCSYKCQDDASDQCQQVLSIYERIDSERFQREAVDSSLAYQGLVGILQPDPQGIKAAELFGFEADYSSLPSVVRDDFASQICIAKIEGYLDKTVENNGGITRYDVLNTSKDVIVVADLRGQRTAITPDNSTSVTYSYFLRAPQDNNLNYIVAISYRQNNEIKKLPIIEMQNVSAGEAIGNLDNLDIPLGEVEGIDEESFVIALLAVYEGSLSVYADLRYPLIAVSSGDRYYRNPGTGNEVGNGNADKVIQESIITTEDLLGMLG